MIGAEKANYKIAWMCRLLGVPRSSFYAWRNRAESPSAARRRQLAVLVKAAFGAGRGAYVERGFVATTIDAIVAAADASR